MVSSGGLSRLCAAEHAELLATTVPSLAEALAAPCSSSTRAAPQASTLAGGDGSGPQEHEEHAAPQREVAALHLEALHALALLLPAPLPEVSHPKARRAGICACLRPPCVARACSQAGPAAAAEQAAARQGPACPAESRKLSVTELHALARGLDGRPFTVEAMAQPG